MIRVHRPAITKHLTLTERNQLAQKQTVANCFSSHDVRIEPTWKNFRRTTLGKAVYRVLKAIFRSKCAFCEQVNAQTANHFYPKKSIPSDCSAGRTFCCVVPSAT